MTSVSRSSPGDPSTAYSHTTMLRASAVVVGDDGIPRIRRVPVANIIGLLESGCTYEDVLDVYGAGLDGLSLADVIAAAQYERE